MNRIGGSNRVRDELTAALAEGRGVTAKVRWINRAEEEGRNKWIHCTPLQGGNGQIGVWMVVIVDDENDKRWMTQGRHGPPVTTSASSDGRRTPAGERDRSARRSGWDDSMRNGNAHYGHGERQGDDGSVGSGSVSSLKIY